MTPMRGGPKVVLTVSQLFNRRHKKVHFLDDQNTVHEDVEETITLLSNPRLLQKVTHVALPNLSTLFAK